jgi:hypothetical protein
VEREREREEEKEENGSNSIIVPICTNNNLSAGAAVTLIFWEEKHSFSVTGALITYV